MQASMIEIVKSCGSYQGKSSLKSWMRTITVRTTFRALKKYRRAPLPNCELEVGVEAQSHNSAERSTIRFRMAQALSKLSEAQRTAVVLRLIEGFSIAEVAEQTGVKEETVRGRLRHGRRLLKKGHPERPSAM